MTMTREVRELRKKDITSTNIGTLFGFNKRQSLIQLWHEKKTGEVTTIDNPYMAAGRELEPIIAKLIGEREGWDLMPFNDYLQNEELRIGSSFDYLAIVDKEQTILEIKNVGYTTHKTDWFNAGIETPPAQYQLQVQLQMFISGIHKAYIGAFAGGNNLLPVFPIIYDPLKIAEILSAVKKFWKSIDENIQPPQEDEPNTELQNTMFHDVKKDKVINADEKLSLLMSNFFGANKAKLKFEKDAKKFKAEMTPLIGDAEIVKSDDFTLKVTKTKDSYAKKDIKVGDLTKKGSVRISVKEAK